MRAATARTRRFHSETAARRVSEDMRNMGADAAIDRDSVCRRDSCNVLSHNALLDASVLQGHRDVAGTL